MRLVKGMILVGCLVLAAVPGLASTVTSSFNNFVYGYTVTPGPGEVLRAFHIYTPGSECVASHYYNRVMPAGWHFDTIPLDGNCVLTFWTTDDALPEGVPTAFGFKHYCAPCCHSWYVSEAGTSDPLQPAVDDDSRHSEPCNIPAEWSDMCGGPGLILAPIYPVAVPNEDQTWGGIKTLYE